MRGYNYILTDPTRPGLVKIGFTDRDPRLRIQELNGTATPVPLQLEYEILIEGARTIEQQAHRMLRSKHFGKEWFSCSVEEAIQVLRRLADSKAEMEKYYKQNREKAAAADAREQAKIAARKAEEVTARAERIAFEKAKLSSKEKSSRAHRFNESWSSQDLVDT